MSIHIYILLYINIIKLVYYAELSIRNKFIYLYLCTNQLNENTVNKINNNIIGKRDYTTGKRWRCACLFKFYRKYENLI
jgi:hypothetical protein